MKKIAFLFLGLLVNISFGFTQSQGADEKIPLKKIALFSSGVGYFEHNGQIDGKETVRLFFQREIMQDVLKSLLVLDTSTPIISYESDENLERKLNSFIINLSNSPSVLQLLNTLKGYEIHITMLSSEIKGRIIGTEINPAYNTEGNEIQGNESVTLLVNSSIQRIPLLQIEAFKFTDEELQNDLDLLLKTLVANKNSQTRELTISLDGIKKRDITIAYVVPTAVWKSSWRLDLQEGNSLLQGWGIVDNTSASDWKNIKLSFITGKPISFIQNLYEPYFVTREEIPLLGVGSATPTLFESGFEEQELLYDYAKEAPSPMASSRMSSKTLSNNGPVPQTDVNVTGEYFEYTLQKEITIPSQKSVMVPIVNAQVVAKKVSVFSDVRAVSRHPMQAVELENSSGMKLPAGAITVYDSGLYVGDALLEFFPENQKRLIAYAEDISLIGSQLENKKNTVAEVLLSKGILRVKHHIDYTKTYAFKNSSNIEKAIVLEHQIKQGSALIIPKEYDEKTANFYRFSFSMKKDSEVLFPVTERVITYENVSFSTIPYETLLSYSTSGHVSQKIISAFEKMKELKANVDIATENVKKLEQSLSGIYEEQQRIRQNIQVLGRESVEGKEYIMRLGETEKERETIEIALEAAVKKEESEKKEFNQYVSTITID